MARTRVRRSGVNQRRRSSTVSGAGPRPATGGTMQPPNSKKRGTASATALENCPPRNIRRAHASAEYLGVGNGHDVAVQDDEVGIFPRRKRSGELFLKTRICRPDRHGLERLLPGHLLLRKPASRRPVVVVLTRNRGVE